MLHENATSKQCEKGRWLGLLAKERRKVGLGVAAAGLYVNQNEVQHVLVSECV